MFHWVVETTLFAWWSVKIPRTGPGLLLKFGESSLRFVRSCHITSHDDVITLSQDDAWYEELQIEVKVIINFKHLKQHWPPGSCPLGRSHPVQYLEWIPKLYQRITLSFCIWTDKTGATRVVISILEVKNVFLLHDEPCARVAAKCEGSWFSVFWGIFRKVISSHASCTHDEFFSKVTQC
jgi:hypothetical protein